MAHKNKHGKTMEASEKVMYIYIYIDCKYIYTVYIYKYIHSIHMCMSLSVLLSCEITFENAFFRVCMETLF